MAHPMLTLETPLLQAAGPAMTSTAHPRGRLPGSCQRWRSWLRCLLTTCMAREGRWRSRLACGSSVPRSGRTWCVCVAQHVLDWQHDHQRIYGVDSWLNLYTGCPQQYPHCEMLACNQSRASAGAVLPHVGGDHAVCMPQVHSSLRKQRRLLEKEAVSFARQADRLDGEPGFKQLRRCRFALRNQWRRLDPPADVVASCRHSMRRVAF